MAGNTLRPIARLQTTFDRTGAAKSCSGMKTICRRFRKSITIAKSSGSNIKANTEAKHGGVGQKSTTPRALDPYYPNGEIFLVAHEFDLLGDPIPENHGKAGANGHMATSENVNKVRLLVLAKWTSAEIANELGVSVPTLNKHYFRNRSIKTARKTVISEARGRVLLMLDQQARAGNVSAIKEVGKMVAKAELDEIAAEQAHKKPAETLGKKQQAKADAEGIARGKGQGMARFLPKYDEGRAN